jgi:hypothetical protein
MDGASKTKVCTRVRKPAGDPVDLAVAAIRNAQSRLIRLLAGEDDSVGRKAAAALKALDPPPIWPLFEALSKERGADSRLKIVAVLAGMGALEPIRVMVVLSEVLRVEQDLKVKRAILGVMVTVGKAAMDARPVRPTGRDPRAQSSTRGDVGNGQNADSRGRRRTT